MEDIFKHIFLNENIRVAFIPCRLGDKSALGQIMASIPNNRQAIIWANGGLVHWRI